MLSKLFQQNANKRTLFIRPVFTTNQILPLSFALCTTNAELVCDSQILDHFPADTPGKEIKTVAAEFHNARDTAWGESINVV